MTTITFPSTPAVPPSGPTPAKTIRFALRDRDGNPVGYVRIDAADRDRVLRHSWRQAVHTDPETGNRHLYAVRVHGTTPAGNAREQGLHRFLLGLDHRDPRAVVFLNGDRLDCRRSNLRIVADTATAGRLSRQLKHEREQPA